MHILVVDDHPTNQRLMQLMLGRFGYEPFVVGDGLAAIEASRQVEFDLILMDRSMPEMDGIAASAVIRDLRPDTRIVMVSAGYDEGQREACLAIGVHGFLDKPISFGGLKEVLEEAIVSGAPVQSATIDSAAMKAAFGRIKDMCNGDLAEVTNLYQIWVDTTANHLTAARDAMQTQDAQAAVRVAHALLGTGGFYGAHQLAEKARLIEDMREPASQPDVFAPAVRALIESAEEAIRWIRAEVLD